MTKKYLYIAVVVYAALFFLFFPSYKYFIDPDATGYLSVAERLAKGDYFYAINGLWSPLGSWLLVPFIKSGFDAVLTAKYLNGFYGLLILVSFYHLIKKLRISVIAGTGVLIAGIFLILHFVFLRLFGDLLQALFLFLYLNVICSKDFYLNYKKIILASLVAGLGFYSKAYTFYFSLAHLLIVLVIFQKRINDRFFCKEVLKKITVALTTLTAVVLPWAFILKYRYGTFMLSRTGTYNMTWSLSQVFKQPRVLFYPPPFPGAYSIWDDPSFWHVTNVTAFTSLKIFFFQIKLILSNFLELIRNLNIYSCFLIVISLFALLLVFNKVKGFANNLIITILVSFILIWPVGILLLHVEARFLWVMAMIGLLLAGVLLTYIETCGYLNKKTHFVSVFIAAVSFCIYPIKQLKDQAGKGKNIYDMAAVLKKNNIGGNLITYYHDFRERDASVILNYLIKGRYFGPHEIDYSTDEILSGIEKNKIDNYILFYNSAYEKQEIIYGTISAKADKVFSNLYPGIVIFSFKYDVNK